MDIRNCSLHVEDHSPDVNPPFCRYYGDDYDCENCKLTEQEKDKLLLDAEKHCEMLEKQIKKNKRKRRWNKKIG